MKRTTRHAEKTPWFRYLLHHPYKGQQLRLQRPSRHLQYSSCSGYDHQEDEEMKEASNSDDRELVDTWSSEKLVSNKFEENRGDKETGIEGLDRMNMWMDRMGLGECVPLFRLHKVDDEVLKFLTVEYLKDMGVPQVGLRWKMYRYIKKFCI